MPKTNVARLITPATILQNGLKHRFVNDPPRLEAFLDELDLMLLNRKTPIWRNPEIRSVLRKLLDYLNGKTRLP